MESEPAAPVLTYELKHPEPTPQKTKGGKERKTAMSHDAAERVAIVLLGELCAARRRVNPQNRKLDAKIHVMEIAGRLREGLTIEDIRHVIAVMEARSRVDPFWADQFDASAPFRKKNISKHLAITVEQAGQAKRNGQGGSVPQPGPRRNSVLADLTRRK